MVRVASFDLVDKYNIVYTKTNHSLPKDFLNKLVDMQISDVIPVQMNISGFAYYRGAMGGTTISTLNLYDSDVGAFLKNLNIKLIQGSLPQNNQHEMLIPIEIALQKHLSVGDFIGNDVSDEFSLQGKYKVCGFTRGKILFAVTCEPGDKSWNQLMHEGIMYCVDNLDSIRQKQLISFLPADVIVIDRDYYEQQYTVSLQSMNILTYVLTSVMIIVLCIALGSLNTILLNNRRKELTILHFIGFTNKYLSQKLWIENLLICTSGYMAGIAVTLVLVWLTNTYILVPQRKILEMIAYKGLFLAYLLPLIISIFSLLPGLLHTFHSMKDISV
jgi:ABC-type transport system, involved in lipoprotein release, permease component